MPSVIERIFKSAKPPVTAATVRVEIGKAETAKRRAEQDLADARHEYEASLLDADPEVTTRARGRISAAEAGVDRANALIAALNAKFRDECEAEAEAERAEAYDAAVAATAKARAALKKYPAAARAITAILQEVAEAEQIVARANRDLPAGRDPLIAAELSVRGLPADRRETIEVTRTIKWYFSDTGRRVAEDQVSKIDRDEKGHFLLSDERVDGSAPFLNGRVRRPVYREVIEKTRFNEARPAYEPDRLCTAVRLPGLMPGEPHYWRPAGTSEVLGALAEREKAAASAPRDPRQPRRVDFVAREVPEDEL
ncbi:hypothetical protein L1787_17865 [Acuticoccus sp. M5D2P5]|uniref:hypothetical protein n=1 Tax=Acuticoccus kalidii TaxID=2910977 RepID=UPI001F27B61F|nr:hypothetical protein [Acuticoccus kalidii]MCF3935270.1 hypothetical protein [Acuticoccus kalidii]